jgi:hypothetical protein
VNVIHPSRETGLQGGRRTVPARGQPGLQAFIIRQPLLSAEERAEMLALHKRYFDNVRPARFYSDLAEKDWVIMLRDGSRLAGFSTQRLITLIRGGQEHRFLFSGDTIVDRAYWREHLLAGCFGHLMKRLMREVGEDRLYWFLISKGYRTFRFLPVFFHCFTPRPEGRSLPELEALLRFVAAARYGNAFDAERGLVLPGESGDRLRGEVREVPASKLNDSFVEFFLKRNPRFDEGHELACLAEICSDNLNRLAWRVIERTHPVWIE